MPLVQTVARPLLSSLFITAGVNHFRHPEHVAPTAEPVTTKLAELIPGLPKDPATLVRVNAAVQVTGGLALATGRFRRIAALALIGSLIPTTLAGHAFWKEEDPGKKMMQRINFQKNLAMIGGLLLAAVDLEGKPSLSWRAKRKASDAGRAVHASRIPLG
jgi:putative oxidoreductase